MKWCLHPVNLRGAINKFCHQVSHSHSFAPNLIKLTHFIPWPPLPWLFMSIILGFDASCTIHAYFIVTIATKGHRRRGIVSILQHTKMATILRNEYFIPVWCYECISSNWTVNDFHLLLWYKQLHLCTNFAVMVIIMTNVYEISSKEYCQYVKMCALFGHNPHDGTHNEVWAIKCYLIFLFEWE